MRKILLLCMLILFASSCAFAGNYVEGDAIVVFKAPESEGVTASAFASVSSIVRSCGAEVKTTYETLSEVDNKIFVHVHSDTKSTQELVAEFQKRDDVIAASPNKINYSTAKRPNDQYYNQLWGLERIKAPDAWDISTGSENIYVAVIDSGFYRHADLIDNIATEYARSFVNGANWDADPQGHGIHVAGTIGAVGDNNIGVTGVNWKIKIIPLRVGDDDGIMADSAVADGLNYLLGLMRSDPSMKIVAVNMSLGGYENYTPSQMAEQNAVYQVYKAFDNFNRSVIVVAAGNESIEVGKPAPFTQPEFEWQLLNKKGPDFEEGYYCYPASYTGLNNFIVVGATDSGDKAPEFTCWGENVDIAAPGAEILSTYTPTPSYDVNYEMDQGTSMAAPHVSGAIGLLASAFPTATPAQLKAAILEGANTSINPTVYPFQYKCELYMRLLIRRIDQQIERGEIPVESRDELVPGVAITVIQGVEPFRAFDGTGKVSKYGFLDVNAALQKLSEIIANSPQITYSHPSSSGCNAGFAGILVLAGLAFIARKR